MIHSIAIHITWFIGAVLVYAEYCYFWQLKWYRFDRFKDFILTKQGRAVIRNPYILIRLLAIVIFFFLPKEDNLSIYTFIILGFFIADIVYSVFRKIRGDYRRPKLSVKAMLIITLAIGIEYGTYLVFHDWNFTLLVSSIRLALLSFIVIAINWLTNQIKYAYFRAAEKKLQRYPHLIKIGITGSYGKTSVKELLAQILGKHFRVSYTPKNVNSDIGISRFILNTNFNESDVAIFEMGAYNKGDIKLVCDIVHPSIGILTAINPQHLSLFGSIENIQTAKYELLRAIPASGLAITNADNARAMEFVSELTGRVMTFGAESEHHPTCLVESVRSRGIGLDITYVHENHLLHVTPAVLGEHQAMNIAPCILVATELGLNHAQITEAINSITQPDQSIKIHTFGTSTIIDDSYNSNPTGFKAALDILGSFPSHRRRIVITRGMHELGAESPEQHERIGNEISFFADELIIITPDFADDIKRGILEKYQTEVKEIFDPDVLRAYVDALKHTDAVILLENRIPHTVRELYLKSKN